MKKLYIFFLLLNFFIKNNFNQYINENEFKKYRADLINSNEQHKKKKLLKEEEDKEEKQRQEITEKNNTIKDYRDFIYNLDKLEKNIDDNFLKESFIKIFENNCKILFNLIFDIKNKKIEFKPLKKSFLYDEYFFELSINDLKRIEKKVIENINIIFNTLNKNEIYNNSKKLLYNIREYIFLEKDLFLNLFEYDKNYIFFKEDLENIKLEKEDIHKIYNNFLKTSPEEFCNLYLDNENL